MGVDTAQHLGLDDAHRLVGERLGQVVRRRGEPQQPAEAVPDLVPVRAAVQRQHVDPVVGHRLGPALEDQAQVERAPVPDGGGTRGDGARVVRHRGGALVLQALLPAGGEESQRLARGDDEPRPCAGARSAIMARACSLLAAAEELVADQAVAVPGGELGTQPLHEVCSRSGRLRIASPSRITRLAQRWSRRSSARQQPAPRSAAGRGRTTRWSGGSWWRSWAGRCARRPGEPRPEPLLELVDRLGHAVVVALGQRHQELLDHVGELGEAQVMAPQLGDRRLDALDPGPELLELVPRPVAPHAHCATNRRIWFSVPAPSGVTASMETISPPRCSQSSTSGSIATGRSPNGGFPPPVQTSA